MALMATACAALPALCRLFAESALMVRQMRRTVPGPSAGSRRAYRGGGRSDAQQIYAARVTPVDKIRGGRADLTESGSNG